MDANEDEWIVLDSISSRRCSRSAQRWCSQWCHCPCKHLLCTTVTVSLPKFIIVFKYLFLFCVGIFHLHMGVCTVCETYTWGQKRVLDPLELLWSMIWVLSMAPLSSGGIVLIAEPSFLTSLLLNHRYNDTTWPALTTDIMMQHDQQFLPLQLKPWAPAHSSFTAMMDPTLELWAEINPFLSWFYDGILAQWLQK